MTQCGDLFRYVPQIEQTGLAVPPKVMKLLLERDRQLEDYLSTLECGGGAEAPSASAIRLNFANQPVGALGAFISFSSVLQQVGTGLTWDSGDPERIYTAVGGVFLVDYGVSLTAHVGGTDGAWAETNDGRYAFSDSTNGAVPETQSLPPTLIGHDVLFLGPGEPIRLFVTTGSGGALTASPVAYHRGLSVVHVP